jgi:cytochrome P450
MYLWNNLLTRSHSVAGSETTATELCGLTNHLLRNPHILKRLTDEIRGAIKTEADINMDILGNLPFMNACIEEGLRIFPPVPVGLLRTVPKGGSLIDGHMVPENVSHSPSSPLSGAKTNSD